MTTCAQHFEKNGVCHDCGIGRMSFLANGCPERPRVQIVCSDEGDWEGLYIDGELKDQDHTLSVGDVLAALGVTYETYSVEMGNGSHLPAKAADLPPRIE